MAAPDSVVRLHEVLSATHVADTADLISYESEGAWGETGTRCATVPDYGTAEGTSAQRDWRRDEGLWSSGSVSTAPAPIPGPIADDEAAEFGGRCGVRFDFLPGPVRLDVFPAAPTGFTPLIAASMLSPNSAPADDYSQMFGPGGGHLVFPTGYTAPLWVVSVYRPLLRSWGVGVPQFSYAQTAVDSYLGGGATISNHITSLGGGVFTSDDVWALWDGPVQQQGDPPDTWPKTTQPMLAGQSLVCLGVLNGSSSVVRLAGRNLDGSVLDTGWVSQPQTGTTPMLEQFFGLEASGAATAWAIDRGLPTDQEARNVINWALEFLPRPPWTGSGSPRMGPVPRRWW